VAANLFLRSIKGSGVAAEGLPRIVCGLGWWINRRVRRYDGLGIHGSDRTGDNLVAANLSSCGIGESGVAAEVIPRIVRRFLVGVGILHEPISIHTYGDASPAAFWQIISTRTCIGVAWGEFYKIHDSWT
jgi:hypothetical protein